MYLDAQRCCRGLVSFHFGVVAALGDEAYFQNIGLNAIAAAATGGGLVV